MLQRKKSITIISLLLTLILTIGVFSTYILSSDKDTAKDKSLSLTSSQKNPMEDLAVYNFVNPYVLPNYYRNMLTPVIIDKNDEAMDTEQDVNISNGDYDISDSLDEDMLNENILIAMDEQINEDEITDNDTVKNTSTQDNNIQDTKVLASRDADTTQQGQAWNQTLNQYVLDVIKNYSSGSYPYLLNNDYQNYNGVTTNIYYKDRLLLKAHPSGNRASHCVGITFEVFFKAMQNRNRTLGLSPDDFNGMSADQLYDFILTWYVANGNKRTSNLAVAVQKYGIGKRITNLEHAQAGDLIDISRENHTGHAGVFINWIREDGKIVGLKYWSSQPSTNGIAYNTEYFNVRRSDNSKYGNVMIDEVYIARIGSVKDYSSY